MALDAGDVEAPLAEVDVPVADGLAPLRPTRVTLDETVHVGAALRAARESLGLDVEDVALATRVRGIYLSALEDFNLDALPARPFAIGYVRAYALALGLDPDSVVARFRREAPTADQALRAPGGVGAGPKQWGWLVPPAVLIAVAFVGWNAVRHLSGATVKPAVAIARSAGSSRVDAGPTQLGAPLPPPVEADAPAIYHTPGLEAATGSDVPPPETYLGSPFVAVGKVFGAPGPTSGPAAGVVLQAKKPTSFIVRAGANTVLFARELAAGEAWRAPATGGLTIDVGSPSAVEIYVGGAARGVLISPQTALAKLPIKSGAAQ